MSRSTKILAEVAAKHKLQVADILGRDRFAHFVAARREAILKMHALGMTHGTIARIMRRDRSTIIHHTNPKRAAYKQAYHARRWRERRVKLNAEISALVVNYAIEQGHTTDTVVNAALRDWFGAAA